MREAGACVDVSRMPLEVRVAEGPVRDPHGELVVVGTTFTTGRLELWFGPRHVSAALSRYGIASETSPNDASRTTITLVRAKT